MKGDITPASELLQKNVEETEKVKNDIEALRKRLKALKTEHVFFFFFFFFFFSSLPLVFNSFLF